MTAGRPLGSPLGESHDGRIARDAARRELSLRARERLRLAAGLLRAGGVRLGDREGFYEGVLAALQALSPNDRQRVRGQVDWVESYCVAEARFLGAPTRK